MFLVLYLRTARHWFHLRVGFRSWGDLEVGVKTKPSPLDMICSEYHDWSMSAIITIHCRHYAKSRYLVIQGIGTASLPICEIKVYSGRYCHLVHCLQIATTQATSCTKYIRTESALADVPVEWRQLTMIAKYVRLDT